MEKPLRKFMIAVTAIGVAISTLLVFGAVASAHHQLIDLDTRCGDGGWFIDYTVSADADRDLTWSVNGAPSQPDEVPFTGTLGPIPNSQQSLTGDVTAVWSNGVTDTDSATASQPDGGCEEPTTTTTEATTSTTTAPTTTSSSPTTTSTTSSTVSSTTTTEPTTTEPTTSSAPSTSSEPGTTTTTTSPPSTSSSTSEPSTTPPPESSISPADPICQALPGEPVDGDGDGFVLDGTSSERPIRTTCDPPVVAAASPEGELPATGSDPGVLVASAGALLLTGGLVLWMSRQRA